MVFKKKTITITEEQDNWLKENCINLSRLVQKAIDERRKYIKGLRRK